MPEESKAEALEAQVDSFVKEVETKGGDSVKGVIAEVKATEAKVKNVTKEAKAKVEQIEAKVSPKCGCGRSETGYCVGLHRIPKDDWEAGVRTIPATKKKATAKKPTKKTTK